MIELSVGQLLTREVGAESLASHSEGKLSFLNWHKVILDDYNVI